MMTAVIINPAAGRGKTKKVWPRLKDILLRNFDFEEHFTEGPGHASRLSAELEQSGFNRIIVVGGDGTLHEVINGLSEDGEIVMGMLPTGTGSDFCRSIGVSTDPEKAAAALEVSSVRKFDLGRVNDRLFVNIAGVGIDAEIAREVNENMKFVSGTAAYLAAVFKLLFSYKNLPLEIVIDDDREIFINSLLLAVGNARYYGGGMCIVPSAVLDDGLFHICAAGDVGRLGVLMTLPKVFSGRHMKHSLVDEYTAEKIKITSSREAVVHADGEIVGALPAEFTILPGRLKFLVPERS